MKGPSLPVVGVAVAKVRCNNEGALFSVWVSGVDSKDDEEDDEEGDEATYGETSRAPCTLFTPFPSHLLHPLQSRSELHDRFELLSSRNHRLQ